MAVRIYGQGVPLPSTPIPIQVHRLDAGQTAIVRTLSHEIGGCWTHWVKGRSRYCAGDSCRHGCSRLERIWKGYFAAQIFRQDWSAWVSVVMELTEHAELDMRGVYARGQVWSCSREVERRGKHAPLVARLVRAEEAANYPEPFCVEQILVHLFHEPTIDLRVRNPLPARLAHLPVPVAPTTTQRRAP